MQRFLNLQAAPGNLHISQAVSLLISCNLKYLRSEGLRILRNHGIVLKSLQKLFHTCHLQCRTKVARKQLPFSDQSSDLLCGNLSCFRIPFQHPLIAHGHIFQEFFFLLP